MNQFSFLLQVEPVSVNHSHGFGRGFKYRLPKTVKFEKEIKSQLNQYKEELNELHKFFDPHLHFIRACYRIYVPKAQFKTKEKNPKISRRSKDIDNMLKTLQDSVFKFINIDDTFVCDLEAYKRESLDDNWKIVVELEVRSLLCLNTL